MKKWLFVFLLFPTLRISAQKLAPLTVDKIMRDPSWIGASPSNPFWSPDGQRLYFFWNPDHSESDSLYFIGLQKHTPQKANASQRQLALAERYGNWNAAKTQIIFKEKNRLRLLDVTNGNISNLIETTESISSPRFGFHDSCIVYQQQNNLFAKYINSGNVIQLTHFKKGKKPEEETKHSRQAQFLRRDALANSMVLRRRKAKKEAHEKAEKTSSEGFPKPIYLGRQQLRGIEISPGGRYITYQLITPPEKVRYTEIPQFVTPSGYIQNLQGRPNVGAPQATASFYIYDRKEDTSAIVSIKQIPGIRDLPAYLKDYPNRYDSLKRNPPLRKVVINGPVWNTSGTHAFVVIRSLDHKDRWIMLLNPETGKLRLLDRQHDDAWIAGPGIGYTYSTGNVGWISENTIWYQSEKPGYSHLFTQQINIKKGKDLTPGKYEIQQARLSPDKKYFYIVSNKKDPTQSQFYQLNIKSGKQQKITKRKGSHEVTVSPDGQYLGFLYSTIVHPWEMYLQQNKPDAKAIKITHKAESPAYRSYPWRVPDFITYNDRDGFEVHAEVYHPEHQAATQPGVIFVHGAGYLQDVKKGWSYYFREHMFMNLLADQGYTVMDMDYRGSAGYGRDWRTAIYRHMGGNDLEDVVDGAKYMTKHLSVNPDKVGLWGGSYGGFMTLMALFKTREFACGAALRSVTDWAHYNHGYTSNILNNPQDDSLAYVRSSPIYFAKGLHDALLMCHGMVDSNVHFQDIVRLTQKLIELHKNNWNLSAYPMESHDFEEPESWRDEYYRIFQLFETHLK